MPPSDMHLLDWLGVSKPRRAAPAAAVIASGGACGGLLVPRVASTFQKTRPLPAAPNATVGYACLDWLGVSKTRRAAPAAAVIASGGACGGRLDHLSQV